MSSMFKHIFFWSLINNKSLNNWIMKSLRQAVRQARCLLSALISFIIENMSDYAHLVGSYIRLCDTTVYNTTYNNTPFNHSSEYGTWDNDTALRATLMA